MSNVEPIPLSEREKQTRKILDFAQDMYDDEDYHKYIWAVAKSSDGGKTFIMTAGRLPVGMSLTCKPDAEIAPLTQRPIIEPTVYKYIGVNASEWKPENHPVILLRTQHKEGGPPDEGWEAGHEGKDDYRLLFDLGMERVIGCVEIWPNKRGKYHIEIGTSPNPADFISVIESKEFENFGPATEIRFPRLVNDRYVQIVTDCNAIKQVRILSMSENATHEEKAQLSHEFYEKVTKDKRKV